MIENLRWERRHFVCKISSIQLNAAASHKPAQKEKVGAKTFCKQHQPSISIYRTHLNNKVSIIEHCLRLWDTNYNTDGVFLKIRSLAFKNKMKSNWKMNNVIKYSKSNHTNQMNDKQILIPCYKKPMIVNCKFLLLTSFYSFLFRLSLTPHLTITDYLT